SGTPGTLAAVARRPRSPVRWLVAVRADLGSAVCRREMGLPWAAFRTWAFQHTGGLYMPPEAGRRGVGYRVWPRRSVAQTPELLLFEVCRDRRVGQRNPRRTEAAERAQYL